MSSLVGSRPCFALKDFSQLLTAALTVGRSMVTDAPSQTSPEGGERESRSTR